ncbi:hypothetical protein Tco_0656149 [Tanacetum coccineum]|uniref:Uncharacterized protein n=1 Tax=Tanacetum coccineum TaxID=301880 RepID=A0ABQ4X7Z0_9ASTR
MKILPPPPTTQLRNSDKYYHDPEECENGYIKNHKKTVLKQANTDTRNGRAQKKPEMQSQELEARVKIVTQAFSLTNLKQGSLVELRKSTRDDGKYTGYTHRSNTKRHIMDCQLGNPCEIVYDPRATIHSPMIEEMEGTD